MMTIPIQLPIELLPEYGDMELPVYATDGAAGFDLRAAVTERIVLQPGQRELIPTALRVAVPVGYELQIRPRSGLAFKHGLTVLNSPGTVDSDYRGEIRIILANLGTESFAVERGMRIAQGVLCPVARAEFQVVTTLDETERGAGGFGHTGL